MNVGSGLNECIVTEPWHGIEPRRPSMMTSEQCLTGTKGSNSDRFMLAEDLADAPHAEFFMIDAWQYAQFREDQRRLRFLQVEEVVPTIACFCSES